MQRVDVQGWSQRIASSIATVARTIATVDGSLLPFIPHAVYSFGWPVVSDTINPIVMAGTLVLVLTIAVALLWFGYGDLRLPQRLLGARMAFVVGAC